MIAFLVLSCLVAMSLGFIGGFVLGEVMGRRAVIRALSEEKLRRLAPGLFIEEDAAKALEGAE